ncbi:8662_t:CDS:1, partial [Ambispora gerdemannii]
HLISEKKAGETLIFWLEAIKNQNQEWKPHTFLTNCDDAQQNAINAVFPNARILLCQWHVKNAWQKNKNKIKANSNYFKTQEENLNNNTLKRSKKQVAQKMALDELGTIMQIRDASQVQNKFVEYFTQWIAFDEAEWIKYIKREYQGKCEKWIDAYRLYEHQEMNTTNFIESWHKKFKYTYLEAKHNHRIDTLIWTLRAALKDAEFECEAIRLMIGRMKPRQREQQH